MRVTVVGTGYVGLVTGACFASMGNHVTCVDLDQAKLDRLEKGEIPIFEPGLDQVVEKAVAEGFLAFTCNLAEAVENSEIAFIAVGTPPKEDGSADLQHVLAVADQLGQVMQDYLVVVDKSTVPVGTAEKVSATLQAALSKRGSNLEFDVVSNPEFLKEGSALEDFMKPDRIIIGADSERAKTLMSELYAPFSRTREKIMWMGLREAEMTKYAANAMLATKISFMNEMAQLCELMGVDVERVRQGIGSDPRIGYSFIYPGCGYGGSCFPKDVKALAQMGQAAGLDTHLLSAVEKRNQLQKNHLFSIVKQHFDGQLDGLKVVVWGLAFKPGTDDMREAPSINLIQSLLEAGVSVVGCDPEAHETSKACFDPKWIESGQLQFSTHAYDMIDQADALVLVTEWHMFRQPDFKALASSMRQKVIFDGRNQYQPEGVKARGFAYYGMGRR